MSDVWIITQKVEYVDGSTREFVASVYDDKVKAYESLERYNSWAETPPHRRRRNNGKKILKTSYELNNWMVH